MSPRPPVPRDHSANTSFADGPRLTAAGTRMDKAPSPALRPLWSAARARPPSGLPVSSQAVWPRSLPGSPQDSRPLTRVLLRPSVSLWVGCWGLREALPSQASSLPWPRQGCPGPDESWSDSSPAAQRPLLWPQTSQGGGAQEQPREDGSWRSTGPALARGNLPWGPGARPASAHPDSSSSDGAARDRDHAHK